MTLQEAVEKHGRFIDRSQPVYIHPTDLKPHHVIKDYEIVVSLSEDPHEIAQMADKASWDGDIITVVEVDGKRNQIRLLPNVME